MSFFLTPFLKSLFGGDKGLAITFWIYGVIATMIFRFLWNVLGIVLPPLGIVGVVLTLIFGLLYLGYAVGWTVGLWRAASKYKGIPLFAGAAQLIVILNIVGAFIVLMGFIG
jgi:hypothetical protein